MKPDVVFIDIQMPGGMDRLACSSAMLKAGIPVKILLLTSYKEFEYAKEAVRPNVFDYLLKHELAEEQLLAVLESIRTEWKNDKEREALLRRQLYADLMNGMFPSKEQRRFIEGQTAAYGGRYFYLLAQADTPLPLPYADGNESAPDAGHDPPPIRRPAHDRRPGGRGRHQPGVPKDVRRQPASVRGEERSGR